MIRSVVRQAWAESPARVIAATVAAILSVPVSWSFLVAYLVGFGA